MAAFAAPTVEPWTYAGDEGRIIRTEHYRVFTTLPESASADRLGLFLESAMANYRTALVPLPAPPQRLDTYLMRSRTQWEAITRQLLGPMADQTLQLGRGGFATRGIGVYYDIGLYDTLAIAAHEGWHQYTQRTFRDQLPVWLEEGLATLMEGHRWIDDKPVFRAWSNLERFDQLRAAHARGEIVPLETLLNSRPSDLLSSGPADRVLTYYAQVWALAHYLNSGGAGGENGAALRLLLVDASEGRLRERLAAEGDERGANLALATRSGPLVFMAYFSRNIDQASAEYARFVDRLVGVGSREAVAAGLSPIEFAR